MAKSSLSKIATMLCLAIMLCSGTCLAFDRVKDGDRYRLWYRQLQKDMVALKEHVPREADVSNEDVERWCSNSLVPGSRAIQNFRDWLSGGSGVYVSGSKISYYGSLKIIMYLLETGIPAGYGGMFPETEGSGFQGNKLAVWYMHVQAGGVLETYFGSHDSFNAYHLPTNGVLERKAYPFLLFEDHDGRLRFGGFGSEWWGAAQFINNAQRY